MELGRAGNDQNGAAPMTTVGEELLRILARQKMLIAVPLCAGVGLAWLVASAQPPQYVANASLALHARQVQVIETDAVVSRLPQESAALRTELDVLSSRFMAERVAQQLDLANDPAFLHELNRPSSRWLQVAAMLRPATANASIDRSADSGLEQNGPSGGTLEDPAQDSGHGARQPNVDHTVAVNWLLSGLGVTNDGRSLTIGVSFRSHNPELAARVANAFAQSYLDDQMETKVQATRSASAWLNQRLTDMRRELEASEAAVQQFRHEAGLAEAGGTTLASQQASELNSQLVSARAERARAESRSRAAEELAGDESAFANLTDVLGSSAVQELRSRLYDVQTELDQQRDRWRGRAGESVMAERQAEAASLRRQIDEEIARVIASLKSETRAAAEREAQIEAALRAVDESRFSKSEAMVRLNQLQREADASRSIYESFLNRYKETIEQVALAMPDARLISSAETPGTPSGPRRLPILLLGLVGGAGFGGALAFVREKLDRRVRRGSEIEEITGAPIVGVLPPAGGALAPGAPPAKSRRHALAAGRFTAALHRAQAVLQLSHGSTTGPQVVLVASASPGDGKTWFSLTLARSLANGGMRVLVLDFDHQQSCLKSLCQSERHGDLGDVVHGRLALNEAVSVDGGSGVHCLGCRDELAASESQIDLAALRMLISRARIEYDAVIVDTPALATSADAAVLSSIADANLLLVRWGKTSRQAMSSVLRFLRLCDVPVDGVIMTEVDLHQYLRYDRLSDDAPFFQPHGAPVKPRIALPGVSGATRPSPRTVAASSRSFQAVAPSGQAT